ncbi:class I SAM-dependent methyltransferase [Dyadobacter sp. BHUBP1]|uniref:class I SAM-dependent methyltransferase n=1 Tax=Dyadobacter sp. BHUBP1 TaxID=3424178 RepID=UPI003D33BE73
MKNVHILSEILKNHLIQFPFVQKISSLINHTTGLNGQNSEALQSTFNDYNSVTDVKGCSILELGPGHTYQLMELALQKGATRAVIADIIKYLDDQIIEKTGIDYIIYDGGTIPLDARTFDLIWSHTVYEHLRYPKVTVDETFRLLRPGGVALHHIDLRDHLVLDENNPDTFNNLQYSQELFKKMTWNRSIYVNRLRMSEWVRLHEQAGFKVEILKTWESPAVQKKYRKKAIAYLQKYSETDAITSQIFIKATKPLQS